jgi:hypothetical protein
LFGAILIPHSNEIAILSLKFRLSAVITSLAFILAAAAVARTAFAWNQQRKIPHEILATVPFAQETGNIALALSSGQGFSSPFRNNTGPTAWLVPVYPLLLAGIFRIFGPLSLPAFSAAVSLNIVFSATTCVPIFYIGRRLGGHAVASSAAWLWALLPTAIMMPFEWIWDTSLSALLAALVLWFTLYISDSRSVPEWCGYGALWGFSLMTNASLGALFLPWLNWSAYRLIRPRQSDPAAVEPNTSRSRPAWRLPALAAAIAILCCAPWTVRNYLQFHKLIPLRSNFSFEFWSGNNSIFDPHGGSPMARITQFGEVRQYTQLGETAYMADKWQRATLFIRSHPQLELQLFRDRLITTWLCTKTPIADFLSTDEWLVRVIILYNALLFFGSIAGIIVLYRRRSMFVFPLFAAPIFFPIVYYVTHVSLRLRHPLDPVLALLTAVSLVAFWQVLRTHFQTKSQKIPRRQKSGATPTTVRFSLLGRLIAYCAIATVTGLGTVLNLYYTAAIFHPIGQLLPRF